MAQERRTPAEEVQRLYDQAESSTAQAFEDLVSRDTFGAVLARATENIMGVVQISNSAFDLVVRNLRLAGRPDLVRLGRQLARTEDKLEHVLQEVERLNDRLDVLAKGSSENGRAGDVRPSATSASETRGGA
jgi:hypothetical protein